MTRSSPRPSSNCASRRSEPGWRTCSYDANRGRSSDSSNSAQTLRSAPNLDGTKIRAATKQKQEAVTKLTRQARSIATQAGQPLSQAAQLELEATLDAAFADEESATVPAPRRVDEGSALLRPRPRLPRQLTVLLAPPHAVPARARAEPPPPPR